MEEREKKPDAGTISGSPQKKIVYAVLAVAVVILAVVLIMKFGYNTDLLNPASGEMSLVGRQVNSAGPNLEKVSQPTLSQIRKGSMIIQAGSCSSGQTLCNNICVDLQNDLNNCGTCGNTCTFINGNGSCLQGQCVITRCTKGFDDCDRSRENGCETNLLTDWKNCGYCGRITTSICGVSSQYNGRQSYCSQGYSTECNAWFADCDHDPANACEKNIRSDPMNCGCCNHVCTATQICSDGVCKNP
jgi:Stigma-specific protein, Stig1